MVISGCGGLYLGGAVLAFLLVAAVALNVGGMAGLAQRFYSRMPGGDQSVEFYRILAACLGVVGLGLIVFIGPQIAQTPCR
jgi:ABC-type hemin transport system ATPase subunit